MADHATSSSGFGLSDGQYDVLRRIVEKVFPAMSVLYAAFAIAWGWGYVAQVTGSLGALAVFGSVILSVSRKNYSADGAVVQDPESPGTVKLQLSDSFTAEDLLNKSQIVFKGLNKS